MTTDEQPDPSVGVRKIIAEAIREAPWKHDEASGTSWTVQLTPTEYADAIIAALTAAGFATISREDLKLAALNAEASRRNTNHMWSDEDHDRQAAHRKWIKQVLAAAGFAIVPTARAGDTVTISRKELDEAVHWYLPSASQANAIIADIIARATRGGTQ